MKPYRLINSSELGKLQQNFKQVIQHWNDTYCVTPLSMSLVLPAKNYIATHAELIHENDKPIALCEDHYLSVIQQALFGNMHTCFNSASHALACILFNNLFKTEQWQINQKIQEQSEWFYPGSICLLLILRCDMEHEVANSFSLALSPDWVYQQLAKKNTDVKTLHSLDDALEEQTLRLSVELLPSTLSVNNLTELQVGDVLSTDHALAIPLRLIREKQLFAQVDLGQSSQHKSIILKRSI